MSKQIDLKAMNISELLDLQLNIKNEIHNKYGFWDGVEALYNLNKEVEEHKNVIEEKEISIKKQHLQILEMEKLGFSCVVLDVNRIAFINYDKTIDKDGTKEFYSVNLAKNSLEFELNELNKINDDEFKKVKHILEVPNEPVDGLDLIQKVLGHNKTNTIQKYMEMKK